MTIWLIFYDTKTGEGKKSHVLLGSMLTKVQVEHNIAHAK
jgi:hypothetical protein